MADISSPKKRKVDDSRYNEWSNDNIHDAIDSGLHNKSQDYDNHTHLNKNITVNSDEALESNNFQISSVVDKIMKNMGYKEGKGMGKSQSVFDETYLKNINTTKGLGFSSISSEFPDSFDKNSLLTSYSIEIIPNWLENGDEKRLMSEDNYFSWLEYGEKTLTSPLFCPIEQQEQLQNMKSYFDKIENSDFLNARSRANPFEYLKKEGFQDRAALKMAEIDKICKRIYSNPPSLIQNNPQKIHHYNSNSSKLPFILPRKRELIYFADICSGPGGWSEYLFTVLKWRAKGYGLTLKGPNDFKLHHFNPNAPYFSFYPCYGEDETGDITHLPNIKHFISMIDRDTESKKLHFVTADGGFSVKGHENEQEYVSQILILSEFIIALHTIRPGGSFLCKLFDTFLPFTIGLLYILRNSFRRFCILKPNQSRPANSERFVVCHDFMLSSSHPILSYLVDIHQKMSATSSSSSIISSIIPINIIKNDNDFYSYICEFNNINIKRQITNLNKIKAYVDDKFLPSEHQEEIRQKCLTYWDIGYETSLSHSKPYVCFQKDFSNQLIERGHIPSLTSLGKNLCSKVIVECRNVSFSSITTQFSLNKLFFTFLPDGNRYWLVSSRKKTILLNYQQPSMKCSSFFISLYFIDIASIDLTFHIPGDCWFDVIENLNSEGNLCYYIIDGWTLNNDLGFYHRDFINRNELLELFCQSMKPISCNQQPTLFHSLTFYPLSSFNSIPSFPLVSSQCLIVSPLKKPFQSHLITHSTENKEKDFLSHISYLLSSLPSKH